MSWWKAAREPYRGRRAVVFLAVRPHELLFRFAESLAPAYDVYISVDDNKYALPAYDARRVTVLRYAGEPEAAGYKGSVLWCLDRASSRCKALYYFCELHPYGYESVWMLEDDVFVPSVTTLSALNETYDASIDLVSAKYTENRDDKIDEWHWYRLRGKVPLPWAGGAICAIRVSPRLMQAIRAYVRANRTLLFDEMMFHTMALQHQLTMKMAPELAGIVFRYAWRKHDIKKNHLYHPIKDPLVQEQFRRELGYK